MELQQIKDGIESVGRNFEEFKKTNDARIKAIESKGFAPADLDEKLAKLNDDITKNVETVKSLQTAMNRPATGDDESKAKKENAEAKAKLEKFLRKGTGGVPTGSREQMSLDIEAKALTADSNVDGGFLVYPQLSSTVTEKVFESSPIEQLADVENVTTDELEVLVDIDEPASGWVSERAARTATNTPALKKIVIPVHELEAFPQVTQKMLDDAMWDVEGWLAKKVSEKFGRDRATAFVAGSGVGKPRGFTTYANGTTFGTIEQVLSGSAGAVTTNGILALLYALKDQYVANAKFLAARATALAIRQLKDSQNRYMWEPNFQVGQPELLIGKPLYFASDMPAVASASLSVACGDFKRGYKIAQRTTLRVLRDPFTNKPYVGYYTTARVGGDVVDFDAIKLLKLT